jgi:hypothetical protein
MKTPFFALTQEIAAADLALRQAADELNRSRSGRRPRRGGRHRTDRRR